MNSKLINILNNNKIAIIPTDTTYGIICDATNDEVVRKVFEAKKRDLTKPFIILASDIEMVNKYTKKIYPLEKEIMEKFWPGPLTILLHKNSLISDLVTANSALVGIRIPDDNNLRKLIKNFGKPIVATSANISGEDIITNPKDIKDELLKNINFIYYGNILNTIPSTIIKVENNKITFIREGELTNKIKDEFNKYI